MKSINLNTGFHRIICNCIKDRSQIMKDKDKIVLIAYDEILKNQTLIIIYIQIKFLELKILEMIVLTNILLIMIKQYL